MYAQGPWEMCDYEAWKDLETKRFSLRVNNAEKGAVAYSSGKTCTEATDNARLIAAAPSLLEALQALMKAAVKVAEDQFPEDDAPIWAYIEDANEAIRKATE